MKHSIETNNKLAGKNVLITAGAQGIGESITKHFIDSGANVAIHYFSSADTANQLTGLLRVPRSTSTVASTICSAWLLYLYFSILKERVMDF